MIMSSPAPRAQLLKELERLRHMLDEEMGEAAAEVALSAIPLLEDVVAATPPADLPGESVFSQDDEFFDQPAPAYPWLPSKPDLLLHEISEWCDDLGELEELLTSEAAPSPAPQDEIPILSLTDVIAAPKPVEATPPIELLASITPLAETPQIAQQDAQPSAAADVSATGDAQQLETQINQGAERVLQALMREHLPRLEAELQTRLKDELGELIRLLALQQSR